MKNRILALSLCLCLTLALLAGCSGEAVKPAASEADASEAPASETPETTASEAPASEAPTPEAPEATSEEAKPSLPLTDETATLSFWWGGFDGGNFGNDNPGVTVVSQALQERTNVEIEYIYCAGSSATEMRNLMYASEEYADMIKDPGSYVGGLEKGCDDDVFMELTDLLEQNAPNYFALINASEDSRKIVTTDSGRQIAFYQVFASPTSQGAGLILRKDYLDKLSLDLPVTYDDWTAALTAVKDEFGAATPYHMVDTGLASSLMSGFGISADWYQVDGQVKYGPMQASFKDYLALVSDWYAKGLISQDFTDHKPGFDNTSPVMNGDVVAITDRASCVTDFMNNIEGSEFVGVSEPVVSAGDELHFYAGGAKVSGNAGVALSTQCTNAELCMAWLDYLYSEEGSLLNSFGVEGETYTVADDGTYQYTDLLLNNPEGLPLTIAKLKYMDGLAGGTGLYDPSCEIVGVNENSIACDSMWRNDGAYVLPSFELNVTEDEEFSSLMSDIETYVSEMVLRYITGAESLDSFDTYLDTISSLNIDKAIALKQTGLDRYNNR